ncbi:MAG: prepilin peptidase, partial [Mucispirillum sp.]|nr:prepilin peptidase [Mucispirillum sp.]
VEGGFGYYMAGISAGYLVLFFPAFIYAKIRKKEGIGEGDFLFFAMIGAFTGLGSIAAILTVASFLGVVAGFMVIFVTKDKNYPVPFAPMLGVAAIIYVFFEDMLNFYNWSGRFILQ